MAGASAVSVKMSAVTMLVMSELIPAVAVAASPAVSTPVTTERTIEMVSASYAAAAGALLCSAEVKAVL